MICRQIRLHPPLPRQIAFEFFAGIGAHSRRAHDDLSYGAVPEIGSLDATDRETRCGADHCAGLVVLSSAVVIRRRIPCAIGYDTVDESGGRCSERCVRPDISPGRVVPIERGAVPVQLSKMQIFIGALPPEHLPVRATANGIGNGVDGMLVVDSQRSYIQSVRGAIKHDGIQATNSTTVRRLARWCGLYGVVAIPTLVIPVRHRTA